MQLIQGKQVLLLPKELAPIKAQIQELSPIVEQILEKMKREKDRLFKLNLELKELEEMEQIKDIRGFPKYNFSDKKKLLLKKMAWHNIRLHSLQQRFEKINAELNQKIDLVEFTEKEYKKFRPITSFFKKK